MPGTRTKNIARRETAFNSCEMFNCSLINTLANMAYEKHHQNEKYSQYGAWCSNSLKRDIINNKTSSSHHHWTRTVYKIMPPITQLKSGLLFFKEIEVLGRWRSKKQKCTFINWVDEVIVSPYEEISNAESFYSGQFSLSTQLKFRCPVKYNCKLERRT